MDKQCSGPITAQLLMRAKSSANKEPFHDDFILLSSTQLTLSEMSQLEDIQFNDTTQQFMDWQSGSMDLVEIRLVLRSSCYNTLLPEDFGFMRDSSAYIVVFSKNNQQEEALMRARRAAVAVAAQERRSTHIDDSNNDDRDEGSSSGDDPMQSPCQLYPYRVRHTLHPELYTNVMDIMGME